MTTLLRLFMSLIGVATIINANKIARDSGDRASEAEIFMAIFGWVLGFASLIISAII